MIKKMAQGVNYIFGNILQKRNVIITGSLQYLRRRRNIDKNYFDYIRLATLELISFEINKKKLRGNVAELGVYKGKFARYINEYFPDRKLYLFDTFEGFDNKDVLFEKERSYSSGDQNFSDTSVESVLARMPFPDQCLPVKGFFPDSAKDISDDFVFVSIDTDLYAPIYNGLKYFYPRLSNGGYIFIHDFNNEEYKGAREAVEHFCAEEGINFLPLPDFSGSAVIIK
jgi:O-methyltransferase